MPLRTGPVPTPRTWLADGEWPHGPLVGSAPGEALVAREAARRTLAVLREREGNLSNAVAALPPAARRAARELLSGTDYPDFHGMVALMDELGTRIWPDPDEVPPATDAR